MSFKETMRAVKMGQKRSAKDVEDDEPVVSSKYFKKEQVPAEEVVDIKWVKSLSNNEYFRWLGQRTNDDIHKWAEPLDPRIFEGVLDKLPPNFIPLYSRIRFMRSLIKTPVDSVGSSTMAFTVGKKFGIPRSQVEPRNYRFQTLMGVMLSAQTKDETNAQAMTNVTHYCMEELDSPNGITLEAIREIEESVLDDLIRSVGFHSRKAKYLKQTAEILVAEHDSDVPTTIEGLLALPGVGPKMAYLTLQKTWGKIEGICVDVHVDRLAKMWHWVDPKKCKTPEHTRKELEKWLPKPLWYEINSVLVGFGQVVCMSNGRRCDLCLGNSLSKIKDDKLIQQKVDEAIEKHLKSANVKTSRGDYSELLKYLVNEKVKIEVKKEPNTTIKLEDEIKITVKQEE